uniref:CCR4-NOT transcription complex subunit 10 n=1 Tax=Schistosoma japonicum TaxID=6182 RepID=Q5DFK3_SCHJA|nr:SJCHGC03372 protein [Schistosoma japonicum]
MSEEVPDDKRLVSDAASCYRRKDFEQCLSILEKLKSGKSNDTNVKINKALLSYIHKSGYSESEQYISELKRIAAIEGVNLDDCDDKILGRRNPDRSDEAHTSKDLLPNTPPHLVSKSPILINLLYNYAVVLFYQRQYAQAENSLLTALIFR